MSGLKLQEELARAGLHVPIVFLTAHGDIHMAVGAIKAGAVDFLTKPFRNQDVLDAVYAALEQDEMRREKQQSARLYGSALSPSVPVRRTWSRE